jgi:hypothetical protein
VKLFIKSLFYLFLALISIGLIVTIFSGYSGSIDLILSAIKTNKTSQDLSNIISASSFRNMQILLFCLLTLNALILWKFNIAYNLIKNYLAELFHFVVDLFKLTFTCEYRFLLIIPVFASVYYALVMPVCYDEGLTYIYFSSKSIFSSISFYPEPNNHVLHSILTNFTYHIPFGGTLFHLRLPSLVVTLFTWMLAYKFIISYFNKQTALVIAALGSMMFMTFYYSYQSRGYALLSLFFIASYYNAMGIISKNDKLENWVWFGVSSVLGFYTMPSFLYPFLTLNVFILVFNLPNFKRQFITNIAVGVTVVCLYLPIIIVNGLNALISNTYVKPIARMDVIRRLPSFITTTMNEITGFPWYLVAIILIPSLIYTFIKGDKFQIGQFLIFLLAPYALLALHSVIPFPRTFVYYGFLLVFLVFFSFSEPLKKLDPRNLTIILFCIQLALLYNFNKKIISYEERDAQLNWSSKKYTNMMVGNKRFYSNDNLLGTTLLYELKTQGFSKSQVVFYNGPVNADTLVSYDYMIISLKNDKTISKKPKITTAYYNIYH